LEEKAEMNDISGLNKLTRIDRTLVNPASHTCASAFINDPYTAYSIPDEKKRVNLHYGFAYYLRSMVTGIGEGYAISSACEGVAVWQDSAKKEPFWQILRGGNPFLPLRCGWQFAWREIAMNRFCEKIKKAHAPASHMYLALLAVAPEHHGKGYASALIIPMLKRLDEERLACYLETQNQKNVTMYQHFGFQLVKESIVPGIGLPIYAMLRKA
jgi:ribosomal protein S18 acetylase RimI-like enzyme